jgi:hypothetical protein
VKENEREKDKKKKKGEPKQSFISLADNYIMPRHRIASAAQLAAATLSVW